MYISLRLNYTVFKSVFYFHSINPGDKANVELGVALMYISVYLSLPFRLVGPGAYDGAAEAIVRISKFGVGEKKFEEMVKSAVDDVEGFS